MFEAIDATDRKSSKAFVQKLWDSHGRIDVLVNNAAVAYDGTLATFPDDRIDKLIDINLTSVLFLTKAVVRFMLLKSSGRIINISSIIGLRGYAGLAAYSASKAGLLGITRSLARELGPRNITVNAIAPGYLATEMSHGLAEDQKRQIIRRTPLGRLGTSEDVAGVVDFLASEAASFITGETITVDGGITC
ncbi:MAG: SDR family NAD(P)-dependent oxidoreductase [Verrucomicrobiales bacterium]